MRPSGHEFVHAVTVAQGTCGAGGTVGVWMCSLWLCAVLVAVQCCGLQCGLVRSTPSIGGAHNPNWVCSFANTPWNDHCGLAAAGRGAAPRVAVGWRTSSSLRGCSGRSNLQRRHGGNLQRGRGHNLESPLTQSSFLFNSSKIEGTVLFLCTCIQRTWERIPRLRGPHIQKPPQRRGQQNKHRAMFDSIPGTCHSNLSSPVPIA